MTPAWLAPPVATDVAAVLPRIETARLVLRAPRADDWPALEPIWTGDRAVHIGGPFTAEEGWLDFNQCVAGWVLRGYGALTITDRATGAVLGLLAMGPEWGDPEPELGWLVTAEAEGRGIATEAAAAGRDWLAARLGGRDFVSYVADGHAASARVAEKLGAHRDGGHPLDPTVAIWRHRAGGAA